jgi:hypothetical protein
MYPKASRINPAERLGLIFVNLDKTSKFDKGMSIWASRTI